MFCPPTLTELFFPGRLSTTGVSPVGWQVSLLREARLHGGEGLCRRTVLPQGVLPLFDLQLSFATGSARFRLWTGFVSLHGWSRLLVKKSKDQCEGGFFCWHPLSFTVLLQGNCSANFTLINVTMGLIYGGISLCAPWVTLNLYSAHFKKKTKQNNFP